MTTRPVDYSRRTKPATKQWWARFILRVGGRIQSRRRQLGMSQQDLARKSGVDRTFLSAMERGKCNPSLQVLCRVCDALEMHIDEVVDTYGLG